MQDGGLDGDDLSGQPQAEATVKTRLAVTDDAAGVAAVHVGSWRAAYAPIFPESALASLSLDSFTERWRKALSDSASGGAVFVGTMNDEIVGFIVVGKSRDDDAALTCGELQTMYVRPDLWGERVGSQLYIVGMRALREDGYSQATLWVLRENLRARRFYERRGWVPDDKCISTLRAEVPVVETRYRIRLLD